jgi:tRNA-Thr(GGU) m(6)t(6)A37 methyltransferase TsaA
VAIEIDPVGVVESPRREADDDFWGGAVACIVLDERFGADALHGLDGFSHAEIIFHFDRVDPAKTVSGARHPRNNAAWPLTGIFAQRAKNRPNRLGSTICGVVRVEGRRLWVSELDAIDGTPVIDIKPVMQEFLPRGDVRQPDWSRELMGNYWSKRNGNP